MSHRRSRRYQQFEQLHQAIRQGLPAQTRLVVTTEDSDYAAAPFSDPVPPQADYQLLVRLAPDMDSLERADAVNQPVVSLAPAFAGSWVIDSILVETGPATTPQAADVELSAADVTMHSAMLRLDPLAASGLHYARCLPLSPERHALAYRSSGLHALVIVHYPPRDSRYECIDGDARTIVEQLRGLKEVTALTLLPEEPADTPLARKLAALVARRFRLSTQVVEACVEQAQDLFALIGKSDVVMVGGSSLYADAIVARAAVFVWRTPQPGTVPIARAWRSFLSHRDAGRLARTQRRCLDDLLLQIEQDGICTNDRRALHRLLADIHASVFKGKAQPADAPDIPPLTDAWPGWVFSPITGTRRAPLSGRLRARTQRTRSLARKFSESPRRFIADSRRLWARPFRRWL